MCKIRKEKKPRFKQENNEKKSKEKKKDDTSEVRLGWVGGNIE